MAKKKQITQQTDILQSNMYYTGKVCLKRVYDGRVIDKQTIHNNATITFLKNMVILIAGKGTNINNYIPNYIITANEDNDNAPDISSTNFKNPHFPATIISDKIISSSDDGVIKLILSATIPGTTIADKNINYIGLYNQQNSGLLAFINIPKFATITTAQSSLVVEWTLSISNAAVQTTSTSIN